MQRQHDDGLFEAQLPGQTREGVDYRLEVTDEYGRVFTVDDAYRYGPVLSADDLHCWPRARRSGRSTCLARVRSCTASGRE
ncbi:MAG: hypothetical protein R2712_27480 [Vicinamibacterales bacterium]